MTAQKNPSTSSPRRRGYGVAAAICALAVCALTFSYTANGESRREISPAGMPVEELSIVKQDGLRETFRVELAETITQVQKGLMFREQMPKDAGMLFYFGGGEGEVSFWMKNTLIPLDMIFIRGDGTIAHIHENAVPHSLQSVPSRYPVAAVLEINGGESAARGIAVGDRVDHRYFAATRPPVQGRTKEPAPEPAPLPDPELTIETPEALDKGRVRGLDADLQQR